MRESEDLHIHRNVGASLERNDKLAFRKRQSYLQSATSVSLIHCNFSPKRKKDGSSLKSCLIFCFGEMLLLLREALYFAKKVCRIEL